MIKKVLLVDDNEICREIFRDMTECIGYAPHQILFDEAGNGQIAIEKLKEVCYNIIILDMMMPILDGIDVLKYIKSAGLNIKVVVVSACLDEQSVRLFNLDSVSLIQKPYNLNDVFHIFKEEEILCQ